MDIQTVLDQALDKISGASYISCVGMDGIALSQAVKEPDFDPAIADAEFANILGYTLKASTSIEAGEFQEMFYLTEKYAILLKGINKDVFLLIFLSGTIQNLGLARIEARKISQKLKEILG